MRDEPKVYPDSNPRAMLERIAETFKDESTRSLLYSMAKRGIRNHGSNNGDKMTEELRAKTNSRTARELPAQPTGPRYRTESRARRVARYDGRRKKARLWSSLIHQDGTHKRQNWRGWVQPRDRK